MKKRELWRERRRREEGDEIVREGEIGRIRGRRESGWKKKKRVVRKREEKSEGVKEKAVKERRRV